MTDEQINKLIHSVVEPGECWHEFNNDCVCQKAGCNKDNSFRNENPNYLDPDQPHSQVVRMVTAFEKYTGQYLVASAVEYAKGPMHLLTMPADQIARALATLVEDAK